MSKQHHRKFPVCPNCGYTFQGVDNFCPRCGQENHDLHVPVSHLFLELLENTLHFDTKFFRTLKYLLFRPGKLTREFIYNRRASYVPPFRLYVFISFFYFLLLSSGIGEEEPATAAVPLPTVPAASPADSALAKTREVGPGIIRMAPEKAALVLRAPGNRAVDSLLQAEGLAPAPFWRHAYRQGARFSQFSPEEQEHKLFKIVSLLMFVLMPLFALLLKLVYGRQKRFYIEHLIFSIHFHCFAFVLFGLDRLLSWLLHADWPDLISTVIVVLYLFAALKAVFYQNNRKTAAKTFILTGGYTLILVFSLVMAALLSIALV